MTSASTMKPVTAPAPDKLTQGAPGTMQDERWLRGFALLEKYRLSWDLRVPFWHLGEAASVARAFPRTPIVLNHTGFPWDRTEEGLAAWRRATNLSADDPAALGDRRSASADGTGSLVPVPAANARQGDSSRFHEKTSVHGFVRY